MKKITRFAPSPTGYLHLGHAFSALLNQKVGDQGTFLIRFEDIDHTRVRPEYYEAIIEDLDWLGLTSEQEPLKQLDRLKVYEAALDDLKDRGLVYPCFCTRKELNAIDAPQQGIEAILYNRKCWGLSKSEIAKKMAEGVPYSWRLDSKKAAEMVGNVSFIDELQGEVPVNPELLGDVVLARKDIGTSYHIAVVIDDHKQGITDVVRGEDLLISTHVHRVLQELWNLPQPQYYHHRLICDESGKRLAKRHDSLSLRAMRERNVSPEELIAQLFSIA